MRAALLALASLMLAGCQTTVPETTVIEVSPADYLPDDYPPRIGGVSGVLGGQEMVWDTYDYSVGAFDSAVQILGYDGETRFTLMGEPVGQPDANVNRLVLNGLVTGPGQTGAVTAPLVEFVPGQDWDGPRLSSLGSAAEVVLDTLAVDEGGYGGRVTGHFSATLCEAAGEPAVVDRTKCQPISGTFDSRLQISGS